MYRWRHLTQEERTKALKLRKESGEPWHGPPHGFEGGWRHVSAACYEHQPIIGESPERIAKFEDELLQALRTVCSQVTSWCVLPNHYHALVQCRKVAYLRKTLGKLHGRSSQRWNQVDGTVGRKCWHRCLPKGIRSPDHRLATMNYIHNNPVKHGYVLHWQDWPFSSAETFLEQVGRDEAVRLWNEYPVLEMGRNWDDWDDRENE